MAMLIYSQGVVLPETMHEKKLTRAHTVPYGVAITIGTLIALYLDPKGEWAGF
jgi:Flp pilus assembly protein protease CpaA